ncbi:MAG: methyltransferase domain-containing protein [Oleibacter sp.]|nr:methyltransferase domain-containing protein [Thalassolituus sp.]
MIELICPKCALPMRQADRQWRCGDGHSYDIARQGYVNLLLTQHKNSRNPGDDKHMVQARSEFLDAGFYQPISEQLNRWVTPTGNLLDIGCGEGYYTDRLQKAAPQLHIAGLDISRDAITAAAKRNKEVQWLVASGVRPPVLANSMKTMITLFTPLMPQGLDAALAIDGDIIVVCTGVRHLYQLRAFIYDTVTLDPYSPIPAMQAAGFECVEQTLVNYEMTPTGGDMLLNLLSMTPHRWKVKPERLDALQLLDSLTTEVDVAFFRFRRSTR